MARRAVHLAREAAVVAGVLEAGRAAGRFDVDDAGATASTLIKATNAFLPYSLSVDELGERDRIAAEVRRMASLLLQGLLVRAPEAAEAPAKQATRPRGPRPAR
jgi:hypothetical protein